MNVSKGWQGSVLAASVPRPTLRTPLLNPTPLTSPPTQDALTEQGDKLEEALAKDPLAGRHEILRQEAIKMVKDNPASIHSFSVKEWMTRKHSDMR